MSETSTRADWKPGAAGEHHRSNGGFAHPWPAASSGRWGDALRWSLQRLVRGVAPDPPRNAFERAQPRVVSPFAPVHETRLTWIGHSTFLLQFAGLNILTDPIWGRRASPLPWAGPERITPPGLAFDDLPEIDAVLLSHDHYDHLDKPTVQALHQRFGSAVRWITPLGYASWFRRLGIRTVTELDWWQEGALEARGGRVTVLGLPAQHWTRREPFVRSRRLWAAFALIGPDGDRLLFAGDTGYHPAFEAIAREAGPFRAVMMPIGAYEPRWFMKAMHMNPEEAVRAYVELGAGGVFAAMHWATFRLTDEYPFEAVERTRAAWRAEELPLEDLWIPAIGETRVL